MGVRIGRGESGKGMSKEGDRGGEGNGESVGMSKEGACVY